LEPSAVLVDVHGDGVALARELATLPWRPRVVLTSINGNITTTVEARNAGARAFVAKAELPNAPLLELDPVQTEHRRCSRCSLTCATRRTANPGRV
jgi:FixJ family two-component response regulator